METQRFHPGRDVFDQLGVNVLRVLGSGTSAGKRSRGASQAAAPEPTAFESTALEAASAKSASRIFAASRGAPVVAGVELGFLLRFLTGDGGRLDQTAHHHLDGKELSLVGETHVVEHCHIEGVQHRNAHTGSQSWNYTLVGELLLNLSTSREHADQRSVNLAGPVVVYDDILSRRTLLGLGTDNSRGVWRQAASGRSSEMSGGWRSRKRQVQTRRPQSASLGLGSIGWQWVISTQLIVVVTIDSPAAGCCCCTSADIWCKTADMNLT